MTPQNQTATPFKSNLTIKLLALLATTALLCTRNYIGLKILSIWRLAFLASIFAALAFMTGGLACFVITLQIVALAIEHLLQQNSKLNKGIIVDPFSLGVSRAAADGANIVQRWIDPMICCVTGCLAGWILSWGAGGWMILSGLSLCLLELAVQKARNRASQVSLTTNT